MKKLSSDEIKKIEFEILKFTAEYLEKNNLKYSLSAGTLLGAIRHKGFIPWDDDIDIMMPREDYDRFIEMFENNNKYRLLSFSKEEDYYYPFAKMVDNNTILEEIGMPTIKNLGVYIDVFPIDGLPNNKILRNLHVRWMFFLKKNMWAIIKNKFEGNIKGRIVYTVLKPFGWKKLVAYEIRLAKRYNKNNTRFVSDIVAANRKYLLEKKWFNDYKTNKFEKNDFYVISGNKEYLEALYGNDYMEIPPENKRITGHNFNAYEK